MSKIYDFDVSFTCRHDESTEQFKEQAIEEVLKLSKYHNHIINGDITIDRQNSNVKAEVLIHIPGHTLRASDQDFDAGKAFDSAVEKAKKQLKKLKDKISDHRVQPPLKEQEVLQPEITDETE